MTPPESPVWQIESFRFDNLELEAVHPNLPIPRNLMRNIVRRGLESALDPINKGLADGIAFQLPPQAQRYIIDPTVEVQLHI